MELFEDKYIPAAWTWFAGSLLANAVIWGPVLYGSAFDIVRWPWQPYFAHYVACPDDYADRHAGDCYNSQILKWSKHLTASLSKYLHWFVLYSLYDGMHFWCYSSGFSNWMLNWWSSLDVLRDWLGEQHRPSTLGSFKQMVRISVLSSFNLRKFVVIQLLMSTLQAAMSH